ncbi:MAG TPA: hypothetical protein VGM84_26505 [Steroidobacteraceae bacterium]|jgi:hypothetical protein
MQAHRFRPSSRIGASARINPTCITAEPMAVSYIDEKKGRRSSRELQIRHGFHELRLFLIVIIDRAACAAIMGS